jgi:hypothetical protein
VDAGDASGGLRAKEKVRRPSARSDGLGNVISTLDFFQT